jgi:hypothetical protein
MTAPRLSGMTGWDKKRKNLNPFRSERIEVFNNIKLIDFLMWFRKARFDFLLFFSSAQL